MISTRQIRIALAFAALAACSRATLSAAPVELPTKEDARLIPVFQADRVWNGVSRTRDGRTFVSYPASGEAGVRVEEIAPDGSRHPYPDAAWNSYKAGGDFSHAFVQANALRLGPDDHLWIVDAGAPGIGKPAVAGAGRIFQIDLTSNQIVRTYPLEKVLKPQSYVDDLRFNGDLAYITDAGDAALIVLNLQTGEARRVLEGDSSTTDERSMFADGKLLRTKEGKELRAQADQLEVSADGKYLYYMPASGPMARIETRYLDDANLSGAELKTKVERNWWDAPTSGGTAIDAEGNIYLNDANLRRILKMTPAKKMSVLISDPRLIWGDAMWIDHDGYLWIPASQQNLTPGFDGGKESVKFPVWIYKMKIGVGPAPNDHS